MSSASNSGGFLQSVGEAIGGFIAGIPSAVGSFFAGVGAGAGVQGVFDWTALFIALALLLSTLQGFRKGRILGPALRGFIGVALLGWAVS